MGLRSRTLACAATRARQTQCLQHPSGLYRSHGGVVGYSRSNASQPQFAHNRQRTQRGAAIFPKSVRYELPTIRAFCAVELKVQHADLQDSIVLCTMATLGHPTSKAGGEPN